MTPIISIPKANKGRNRSAKKNDTLNWYLDFAGTRTNVFLDGLYCTTELIDLVINKNLNITQIIEPMKMAYKISQ